MDALTLVAVGGGLLWLSRRMAAPVQSSVPPPAERQVIVERERATPADDPGQMNEDLKAWADRARSNGGGDYYTAAMPPPANYVAVWRGGSESFGNFARMQNGVIAAAPFALTPDVLIGQVRLRMAKSGLRGRRGLKRDDWGLPGSRLAVRLAPVAANYPRPSVRGQRDTGGPPRSALSLIEQLPGQVAGGVPLQSTGVTRVRGLVALGSLWTVARTSRNFWWVADAASSRAGAPDMVIEYLVSPLGRAAVILGRPRRGQPNKREMIGQLAPEAWTPVVVDATGRPARSPVLPRSDYYPYDARGPARSPFIGQAMLQFLDLPVVELPGLRVYGPDNFGGAITRRRMYDGALWSSPAWRALRAKIQPGENWAQDNRGRRAYG